MVVFTTGQCANNRRLWSIQLYTGHFYPTLPPVLKGHCRRNGKKIVRARVSDTCMKTVFAKHDSNCTNEHTAAVTTHKTFTRSNQPESSRRCGRGSWSPIPTWGALTNRWLLREGKTIFSRDAAPEKSRWTCSFTKWTQWITNKDHSCQTSSEKLVCTVNGD